MTRTPGRRDSDAVRLLVSATAIAATLVAWVSLARVAHVDVPDGEPSSVIAVPSPDPDLVDVGNVVDVTTSASGRTRGRR